MRPGAVNVEKKIPKKSGVEFYAPMSFSRDRRAREKEDATPRFLF
jgi:hypothetical protein